MKPSERLNELNIFLPEPPKPVAAYVPGMRVGNLVYVSGQLPSVEGKVTITGKVGGSRSLEEGQAAARLCAINALAIAAEVAGDIDKIARIIRLAVFVNSAPGFTEQPKVANGASELMLSIFRDAGRHVRAAVGAAELPLDAAVEVEMIAEIGVGGPA